MALSDYLNRCLQRTGEQKKALLMTHVVCGYPSFDDNWQELEIMAEAGVALVELQFPFSEPLADGPLFVKANQSAIANGVQIDDCFEFMRRVSAHFEFKVLMMGYYNTLFKYGEQRFLNALKQAGGSGFIVPDLPIEEAEQLHRFATQLELDPILLMTPTSSDQRLAQLASAARGFIYCVARKGVTGSQTEMNADVAEFVQRCRQHTSLPLAIGFGVSGKQDLAFIDEHGEVAVIGTAALRAWEAGQHSALRDFFIQLGRISV